MLEAIPNVTVDEGSTLSLTVHATRSGPRRSFDLFPRSRGAGQRQYRSQLRRVYLDSNCGRVRSASPWLSPTTAYHRCPTLKPSLSSSAPPSRRRPSHGISLSPITYGTPLSAAQLDATAIVNGISVPGTFAYTPAVGTVLFAGSGQTLNVTFTPDDTTDFTTASGSTTIDVLKATPTISVSGADVTYDGMIHAATATITRSQWQRPRRAADAQLCPKRRPGRRPAARRHLHGDRHLCRQQRLQPLFGIGHCADRPGNSYDHLGTPGRHRLRHGAERHAARRRSERGGARGRWRGQRRPVLGSRLAAGSGTRR